jgi:hypothetical protein
MYELTGDIIVQEKCLGDTVRYCTADMIPVLLKI